MVSSGLQLPGSLNVAQRPLSDVGTSMNVTATSAIVEADRLSADGTAVFTYYILHDYNINGDISYYPAGPNTGEDDAYSMNAISVTSGPTSNPVLELPTASNITVYAGKINAEGQDAASPGIFPVTLTVSVNSVGIMTSSITISGIDYIAHKLEDPAKAQVVYWDGIDSTPTVDANTADVLSSTLTPNELVTHYTTALDTINSMYDNQNMILSWNISVAEVTRATNNTLSKHARHLNKSGSTLVFETGDKLVCATPFQYGVSFKNYLDATTTIVLTHNVYGVLQQS